MAIKPSQQSKILDYIRNNGSVTAREIYTTLNINGATARISDLRKAGWNIETERVKAPGGAVYNVYRLGTPEVLV